MKLLRKTIRRMILESSALVEADGDNYSVENPLGHYVLDYSDIEAPEPYTDEEKEMLEKVIDHIERNDSGNWSAEFINKLSGYLNHPKYSKLFKANPAGSIYVYRGMTLSKEYIAETLYDIDYEGSQTDLFFETPTLEEFSQIYSVEAGFPISSGWMFGPDEQEDIYGSRKQVSSWTWSFERAKFFADKTFAETKRFNKGDGDKQSIVLVAKLADNDDVFINLVDVFSDMSDTAGAYKREREWLALGEVDVCGVIPINEGYSERDD